MKLELSLAICGSKNSHFEVGLDLLIINSELSIMHQNCNKERNQSIIPWHNLTKSKHSFELCNPPSVYISLPLFLILHFFLWYESESVHSEGCLVNLSLSLSCLSCLSCVWVCLSVATLSKRMFPSLCLLLEWKVTILSRNF